jgi:hypothetical protein
VPQTHAQRQAAYRQRQAAELAALQPALAEARLALAESRAEIARLRQERERLYELLEEASAAPEPDQPQTPACPHPAHLMDGDRCGGCGQVVDVW